MVGLDVISEDAAGIPQPARGQWIPVRARRDGPLPQHPGGYLIVAVVDDRPDAGAAAIAKRIARWAPGERLVLRIRRNPSRSATASWWESDVVLVQPER